MSTEKNRFIFYGLLLYMIIISLLGVKITEEKKNKYIEEQTLFYSGMELLSQNKPEEALIIFNQVDERHKKSFVFLYNYALALDTLEDYSEAEKYLIQVKQIRPQMLQNQSYLTIFGINLFNQEKYDRARIYLEESIRLSQDDRLKVKAKETLDKIEGITLGEIK